MASRLAAGFTLAGFTLAGALAFAAGTAHATSPAEARAVALAANCQPGKVDVLRQQTGNMGETVFKIACADAKDRFVLVQCRFRQCVLLR